MSDMTYEQKAVDLLQDYDLTTRVGAIAYAILAMNETSGADRVLLTAKEFLLNPTSENFMRLLAAVKLTDESFSIPENPGINFAS